MNNDKQLIATETLKRTRTSPRLLVIKEVQALIQAEVAALPTISDEHMRQTIHNLLTSLSAQVEKLLEGHPKKDKSSKMDDDTSEPKVKGKHFVGVRFDGSAAYVKLSQDGTYLDLDGNSGSLSQVYGPFSTQAGAIYAASHKTYTNKPLLSSLTSSSS